MVKIFFGFRYPRNRSMQQQQQHQDGGGSDDSGKGSSPRGGGGTEGERKKPPSPSVGNFNFASAKKRQKTKAAAGRVAARGDRLEKFFFKPTFWRNIRQSQFSTQIAEDDPSGRGVLRALQPTADQVSQKFGFVFFAFYSHCMYIVQSWPLKSAQAIKPKITPKQEGFAPGA